MSEGGRETKDGEGERLKTGRWGGRDGWTEGGKYRGRVGD